MCGKFQACEQFKFLRFLNESNSNAVGSLNLHAHSFFHFHSLFSLSFRYLSH